MGINLNRELEIILCLWGYESSEASIWKLPLMLPWGEMLPPPLIFPPKARRSAHEKIGWDMTALPWAQTIPSQTSPSTPLPLLESSLCDWIAVAVILHQGQIWGRNLRYGIRGPLRPLWKPQKACHGNFKNESPKVIWSLYLLCVWLTLVLNSFWTLNYDFLNGNKLDRHI